MRLLIDVDLSPEWVSALVSHCAYSQLRRRQIREGPL